MYLEADISNVSAYIPENESQVVGGQGIFIKLMIKFAVR
jgi:hypothetical protein